MVVIITREQLLKIVTHLLSHLNDEHLNICENLDLIMNMYNLIEYSTASLYQFKIQE